jgi:2-dehydropantoate 2-reductase
MAEVLAVERERDIALADSEISRILEFCDSLPETNKPSLLRDLEAGLPTEIDDLSGAIEQSQGWDAHWGWKHPSTTPRLPL